MMFRVRVYGEVLPKNRFCAIYRVDLKNQLSDHPIFRIIRSPSRVFW